MNKNIAVEELKNPKSEYTVDQIVEAIMFWNRKHKMRNIIIELCPVGFKASREEFDLGDKIGTGKTPEEALEDLLFMEGA